MEKESEDARATLPAGMCSSSLPTGKVLLVVDLSSFSRSLHFSSVVLAAPASSSAAHCPNAVVAFVTLNDGAGDNEEMALLVARSCANDRPLDQSVNFDELAMGNLNECGEERATASLRRQMELFIERAAHGELELHASSVLVFALQLVSQGMNLPATYDAGKEVMLLTVPCPVAKTTRWATPSSATQVIG